MPELLRAGAAERHRPAGSPGEPAGTGSPPRPAAQAAHPPAPRKIRVSADTRRRLEEMAGGAAPRHGGGPSGAAGPPPARAGSADTARSRNEPEEGPRPAAGDGGRGPSAAGGAAAGHAAGARASVPSGGPVPSDAPAGGGGVHAGRDIHVRNQGSGAAVGQAHIVNNYQVTQAPVRLPYRIGRVPALASPFQERGVVPELAGGESLVLAGMFGTGMSQLAAHYAESAWERGELHLLLWADASSREAVLSAYARTGQDVLGRTYADEADGAQAFLNWLRPAGGTQPHPWLVVLDGVTDPAHLAGLWPPASPAGRVLVTSSRNDFESPGAVRVVRVPPFTYREVRAYLESALNLDPAARRSAGDDDAEDFVEDAADEILEGNLPLDAYLDARAGAARRSDRPTPVERSVEAAAALAPDGVVRPVLGLLRLLGGNVPEHLLLTRAARSEVMSLRLRWETEQTEQAEQRRAEGAGPAVTIMVPRSAFRMPPVARRDVLAALRALEVTGLIERKEKGVLRLVRLAVPSLPVGLLGVPVRRTPEGRALRRALGDVLAEAWPDAERGLPEARLLWDCVEALKDFSRSARKFVLDLRTDDGLHPLAFRYGRSLGAWGRYAQAEQHFRDMAGLAAATHGAGHPDVLRALSCAAGRRGARGDDFGAAEELAGILARQREALGDEHPDVLATRHDLAFTRLSGTGWDAPGPRAELAAVLRDRARTLGVDHADTLVTAMAVVRGMLGRGGAGEPPAGEDADAVREVLLGERDGEGARDTGPTAVAEALHTGLRGRVGEDHPLTVEALRMLAVAHLGSDDPKTALRTVGWALGGARRALGLEHPVTADCRLTVAVAGYGAGSGHPAAVDVFRGLRALWEELHGPDHPSALEVRGHLLRLSTHADDGPDPAAFAEEAAELLADTERVFGTDHRRTRELLARVAETHDSAGNGVAALVALSGLAARCARVPGPGHPETLGVRLRAATLRGRQGDTYGALTALAALHADCVHALGPEHRTTLGVCHQLALNRYVAGDTPGALSDLARVLRTREHLDGPDAEPTREVRDDLERLQKWERPVAEAGLTTELRATIDRLWTKD
ncbi:hypothetical protein [Streptomyces sp. NPDC020983]|uniref:hypothetical protein n=1 Tax=Streptomyces sp. NPDC020983 TaxID=3365106 RepID=UPI0037A20E40